MSAFQFSWKFLKYKLPFSLILIECACCQHQAKAEQEELKRREFAELKDKAEQMMVTGELPFYEKEKRGMGTKVKQVLTCHHGGT